MSARDDILGAIRARTRPHVPEPSPYRAPVPSGDLLASFTAKARAADAEVRVVESAGDIPAVIAEMLRARNLPAAIHIAPESDLAFDTTLQVFAAAPGPDDTAVTRAPLAIAETGTLVQPARTGSPASWHFRPGFEIAILQASGIVTSLEDALKRIGTLPATVNLITGPSRTGDIEQTLELGAHGPKELAVVVVK
jgi:L-lactate dehydrogenase complex protein LldG